MEHPDGTPESNYERRIRTTARGREGCFAAIKSRVQIMESFKKEQLNHRAASSFNLLEGLPDVVFYAVMEKLPARVIEKTVRQLSKNCYRRVELRRARLPRIDFDKLRVEWTQFYFYRTYRGKDFDFMDRATRCDYMEAIDPANLIQHLEYLKERTTFNSLELQDVNWDIFANCKFECNELACHVFRTTLLPERFMDIFLGVRPTRKLIIWAHGDNKIFPITSDFFTNNYAVGLRDIHLNGHGNAMIDPLNDTILLDLPRLFKSLISPTRPGCTVNWMLKMIRDWYASESQIDQISLQVVNGEAEVQNCFHNLPGLQAVRVFWNDDIHSVRALKRANGDVVRLGDWFNFLGGYVCFYMIRLVPGPEGDLYKNYYDVE